MTDNEAFGRLLPADEQQRRDMIDALEDLEPDPESDHWTLELSFKYKDVPYLVQEIRDSLDEQSA